MDSPGLGESEQMDEVLMNYLPNAFAFIYILDVSRAGGLDKESTNKVLGGPFYHAWGFLIEVNTRHSHIEKIQRNFKQMKILIP